MDFNKCSCSGKSLGKLVKPSVLAVLAGGANHGYEIARRCGELGLFGDGDRPDMSGIYRVLKELEKQGLVRSSWDLEDDSHAKRKFEITNNGLKCLKLWRKTLADYRQQVGRLLTYLDRL